jgi:5-formyltetrahydrofolate cyclo-ligase
LTSASQEKAELRKELRQRRRDLSAMIQQQGSESVCQHLLLSEVFAQGRHIALYLAQDGELSLTPLINEARALGKTLYLPVIDSQQMNFYPWPSGAKLRKGTLGINELTTTDAPTPLKELALVLVPLVGFDDSGMRLGMGGGFYDRSFQVATKPTARPRLLGVAHSLQQCTALPMESWDQRLDGAVTEKGLRWF